MIEVPPQIQIDVNTVKSKGTCATAPCTVSEDKTKIIYQMTGGAEAGKPIIREIGGVVNPRSMATSGEFVVTTLDTDGVS